MKKLLVPALLMSMLCWSCDTASKKDTDADSTTGADSSERTQRSVVQIKKLSLDSIDAAVLVPMIKDFDSLTLDHVPPQKEISYWISKEMLLAMHDLIKTEQRGRDTASLGVPDGFRIHFIAKGPGKSDFSLALVSTKNGGSDPQNPGYTKHSNYYEHDVNHPLFKLVSKGWKKCYGKCDSGAALYQRTQGGQDDDCRILPRRRIKRTDAEVMVEYFVNKSSIKENINTSSVWFDYGLLEAIFKAAGAFDFDGMRIYYGTYPVHHFYEPGRDTFVLQLTKKGLKPDTHIDKFDCAVPQFLKDKIHTLNNGQLCPKHCP